MFATIIIGISFIARFYRFVEHPTTPEIASLWLKQWEQNSLEIGRDVIAQLGMPMLRFTLVIGT